MARRSGRGGQRIVESVATSGSDCGKKQRRSKINSGHEKEVKRSKRTTYQEEGVGAK